MTDSRTKNAARNIVTGLISCAISLLFPFLNRTAVLWLLGAEFTGLAGLFTSILSVLSIAELGFNSAVVYSLYRPIAERDEDGICKTVSLLRRIYSIVGMAVFGLGLCAMPFLPLLIKGSYPSSINLYVLYFLYLFNSGISYYLFAYQECLLIADQRRDISNRIRATVSVIRYILQVVVLLLTRSFYLYVATSIIGTVLTNLAIHFAVQKRYPYLHQVKTELHIPEDMKKHVKGLLIDRICNTCRNSLDSIIISSVIGLVSTAIYGNYFYVFNALYGILLVISNAMGASVGNSMIQRSVSENFGDLLKFSMIFAWISGWCMICMVCLFQPFMLLWAGQDLLLPEIDVFLFGAYLYLICMNNIRNLYIDGCALWWKLHTSYVVEAVANLCLNLLLGKLLGVTGIILATVITIFLFCYLQRNAVLFRNYFNKESMSAFYSEQFSYGVITLGISAVTYWLCIVTMAEGVSALFVRGAICVFIPNALFYFSFRCLPRFAHAKDFVLRAVKICLKKENGLR